MSVGKSVTFAVSQDLNVPLQVRIDSLEGSKQLLKASERLTNEKLTQVESNISPYSNMLVSGHIVDVQRERFLTIPVFTPYVPFKGIRKWDHWMTLPIKISQLTMTSRLALILWEYNGSQRIPFHSLHTSIFDKRDYSLKRGSESLKFHIDDLEGSEQLQDDPICDNLNKYYLNEFKSVDWLDKLTLKILEGQRLARVWPVGTFVLNIEFPVFDLPIVYTEKKAMDIQRNIPTISNYETTKEDVRGPPQVRISLGDKTQSTLKFYDPDQFNSNPIEEKYRRLERAAKHSDWDKQVKPNARKRDYLNKIINYPPGRQLTAQEKGSVWKYRYYLINNRKALTKLLQSTNLNEESESAEVLEMMDTWAEINIEDALELLGPEFSNLSVRSYAVNRLKKASNKELELYLLQLVQAISFENFSSFVDKTNSEFTIVDVNASQKMLKSVSSSQESKDLMGNLANGDPNLAETPIVISPLAEFLIKRALSDSKLGNYFFWYLKSESQDKPYLTQISESFWSRLDSENKQRLSKQIEFIKLLHQFCLEVKGLKDSTVKKIELLHELLNSKMKHFLKHKQIHLPLDPDILLVDVLPEKSKVFKSSLSPLMISFKTADNSTYQLMYKVGDDLRQDQLVVQIIRLMDELLKNENVDLKLTPYKILATGPQEGAMQFIPNSTLASILSSYHGIVPFLRKHHPDPDNSADLNVQNWVMDNFVKSCAGYCVITYILGVGDRHLDNLLITPEGKFFHADFGYILGQDPKPFPPLMKLPLQIIEAFGGAESENYNKFRSYCFVSYSILRRNAGLILNLFELMKNSTIPDIRIDPDGAILKVKERFNLDMSEEEATFYFQTLINDSVNALLPIVIDHLHNLAQYWRA
ncbi:phosphatidylinositol 3-kinase VPS34 KNAG_0A02620 [Huiozyma naganishii CBS 8797]|uniref:Phosphatidylinositol 3-kinase VPS34 n=1 Tax=Huiozyma naganishii (strain ATCC MYA-139 / BCRC 22969 / CBS 8797 / KCTC 17520 / NBRC 10181 / NCYC 3082 / Yp74L-3) TaxID=1071383 RepID=J7S3E7_HUIN7|nr:hypothetical protein KNAG_0A02620 [Kazachstania naganishii CBS 8797]CCK67951.1 hypothetical protein KNAG_0A02620 [Kazachstania naganishii CBS 8797]